MKKIKFFLPGSRLTNFVGILSQGLRIAPPEAPATGYMVLFLIPFHLSSLSLLMHVLNLTCAVCFLWGPYSISFFLFPFRFNLQFGKGIYFADLVSKSAQYCYTDRNNPVGLMILSEVALGEVYELKKAEVNSIFIVFVCSCVFLELNHNIFF